MRIAVYHNLPSGGAKRSLRETIRRIAQTHAVDAYSTTSGEHDFGDIRPFVREHRVYRFAKSQLFESPFGRLNQGLRLLDLQRLWRVQSRIASDIRAGAYDVVLVQPCQFEGCPSIVRMLDIPTVYFCQEPPRNLYEAPPARPYFKDRSVKQRMMDAVDPLRAAYFLYAGSGMPGTCARAGGYLSTQSFRPESCRSCTGSRHISAISEWTRNIFGRPNNKTKGTCCRSVR